MLSEIVKVTIINIFSAMIIIAMAILALMFSKFFNLEADNPLEEMSENIIEEAFDIELDISPNAT